MSELLEAIRYHGPAFNAAGKELGKCMLGYALVDEPKEDPKRTVVKLYLIEPIYKKQKVPKVLEPNIAECVPHERSFLEKEMAFQAENIRMAGYDINEIQGM